MSLGLGWSGLDVPSIWQVSRCFALEKIGEMEALLTACNSRVLLTIATILSVDYKYTEWECGFLFSNPGCRGSNLECLA